MSKLADELARFEEDLDQSGDDSGENVDLETGADEGVPEADEVEEPETDESGQVADSDDSAAVDEGSQESSSQGEAAGSEDDGESQDTPQFLTTLPDDKEAFGELAGQKVTAEQIIAAGLMEKFASWGHQGRHLVQKGQKDLEEAKQAKSETERLIELLENKFEKDEVAAAQSATPQVTEQQFAEHLTNTYIPQLKKIAEEGGIEADFIKEFPKATAHIEHRFQSGGELLQGLINEVSELREFVGMQKEKVAEETAVQTFEGILDSVAEQGDLFSGLANEEMRKSFTDFLTDDNTKLRITDKEVQNITADDVASAWLYYAHTHPEVLQKKEEPREKPPAHLAGGGRGKSPTPKTHQKQDELSKFESEFKEALDSSYDA